MNTSEYYILAIEIHVHENGTINMHIHSSLVSISFASYTFQSSGFQWSFHYTYSRGVRL